MNPELISALHSNPFIVKYHSSCISIIFSYKICLSLRRFNPVRATDKLPISFLNLSKHLPKTIPWVSMIVFSWWTQRACWAFKTVKEVYSWGLSFKQPIMFLSHVNCYWCKQRSQSWNLSLMNITCIFYHGQYLGVYSMLVSFYACFPGLRRHRIRLQCRRPGFDPWKGMATQCNILAWRIPWTEKPVNGVTKSQTWLRHFHFLCLLDIWQHPSPPLPAFFLPQIFVACLPHDRHCWTYKIQWRTWQPPVPLL